MRPVLLIPYNTDGDIDMNDFEWEAGQIRAALPGYNVIFVNGMSGSAIIVPPLTNNNNTKEPQQP